MRGREREREREFEREGERDRVKKEIWYSLTEIHSKRGKEREREVIKGFCEKNY